MMSRSWSHASHRLCNTRTVQSIGPKGRKTSKLRPSASRRLDTTSRSSLVATSRARVSSGGSPADAASHRGGEVLGSKPAVTSRVRSPGSRWTIPLASHRWRTTSGAAHSVHRVGAAQSSGPNPSSTATNRRRCSPTTSSRCSGSRSHGPPVRSASASGRTERTVHLRRPRRPRDARPVTLGPSIPQIGGSDHTRPNRPRSAPCKSQTPAFREAERLARLSRSWVRELTSIFVNTFFR